MSKKKKIIERKNHFAELGNIIEKEKAKTQNK